MIIEITLLLQHEGAIDIMGIYFKYHIYFKYKQSG